ncbi:MAG: hypothetical protein ACK4OO_01920 [bacterium]
MSVDNHKRRGAKLSKTICKVALLCLLLVNMRGKHLNAQQPPSRPEEVIMLEEIRIRVEPERPTVVTSIPRQAPRIEPIQLKREPLSLILSVWRRESPHLESISVRPIEGEREILARERK